MARLEDLTRGASVKGVLPEGQATVVDVKWIGTIAPEQTGSNWGYFAAYILEPGGKRIGAWYSNQSLTTIKFHEGNRVQVWPPDPEPNLNFRTRRLQF